VLKLVIVQTVHIYADVQSNSLLSLLFFGVHFFVSRNIKSCRQAAVPDRRQRSSRFPCSIRSHAHRCSCLMP